MFLPVLLALLIGSLAITFYFVSKTENKLTDDKKLEKKRIYKETRFHKKTWFRFLLLFMFIMITGPFFRYADNIAPSTVIILKVINMALVVYFLFGKSKTKVGKTLQIVYGVVGIAMNLLLFFI